MTKALISAFVIVDLTYPATYLPFSVTARGKTRHTGAETSARYDLSELAPALQDVSGSANYA